MRKAAESKQNKQEETRTVILPLKLVFSAYILCPTASHITVPRRLDPALSRILPNKVVFMTSYDNIVIQKT